MFVWSLLHFSKGQRPDSCGAEGRGGEAQQQREQLQRQRQGQEGQGRADGVVQGWQNSKAEPCASPSQQRAANEAHQN